MPPIWITLFTTVTGMIVWRRFRDIKVLLTSYGLVINDLELLKQIPFDVIIADESQAIKNTQSLRYKAITKLTGKF